MTPKENAIFLMQKSMQHLDFKKAKELTGFFIDEILQVIWGSVEEHIQDYWNETKHELEQLEKL